MAQDEGAQAAAAENPQVNEFRKDYVTGQIVIIAKKRGERPTDFKTKKPEIEQNVTCPFCKGNEHITPPTITFKGASEKEWAVRCFANKFSALDISGNSRYGWRKEGPLMEISPAAGAHEVIVESGEHGTSMTALSEEGIAQVYSVYKERFDALSRQFPYVLIFQNYGKEAGASLSHLHAQVAGFPFVPGGIQRKIDAGKISIGNLIKRGRLGCPYCAILKEERLSKKRIVFENEDFTVICPFASGYKYQTLILPKRHTGKYDFPIESLAKTMKRLLGAYEKTLGSFSYNYIINAGPSANPDSLHWHLDFLPKLSIHAGIENGADLIINSTPPEEAAEELRKNLD